MIKDNRAGKHSGGTGGQEVKGEVETRNLAVGLRHLQVTQNALEVAGRQAGRKVGLELSREKGAKAAAFRSHQLKQGNRCDHPGKYEGGEEERAWGPCPAPGPASPAPAPSKNGRAPREQLCWCFPSASLGLWKFPFIPGFCWS